MLAQRHVRETKTNPPSQFFYPNTFGRIVLMAMEEIMGRHGVNAVLNLASLRHLVNNYPPNNLNLEFGFDEFGVIQETVDKIFGVRGGRGLALRAGRETFKRGVKELGPILGIADLMFRPFPLGMKMKIGLDNFARTFNTLTDQIVRVEEASNKYYWVIERCAVCWNRKTEAPCCHLAVGILEQASYWVSNGKNFRVEEIKCIAKGDATCTIAIDKQPMV
jgi:predicted hydrocarbon binding protein